MMIIITMVQADASGASTRPILKVLLPVPAWALIRASTHLGWRNTTTLKKSNSTDYHMNF